MIDDPYKINAYATQRIDEHRNPNIKWTIFTNTLKKTQNHKHLPSKESQKKLLDLNNWLLLFHGYPTDALDERIGANIIKEDTDINIEEIWEEGFKDNVKKLYTIFNFDLKSFYNVWEYQHNIKRLLYQIVRPEHFLGNRFYKGKRGKNQKRPKYELTCTPTRYDNLPLPKMTKTLDGLIFPVMLTKNNNRYRVERLEVAGFGDGDFITDKGQIIDCIRINDFWQTGNHLKQRLSFSFLVQTDYDEAPMVICNNMKDMKKAWKLLGANSKEGVLVRSLGENLYDNFWLLLNEDSVFLANYKAKGGYSLSNRMTKDRGFVRLNGDRVGNLGYDVAALRNISWLDEFDIERFQDVVFQ